MAAAPESQAKALTAWEIVRTRHGRTFSDEFREGFLDGFIGYVEKGRMTEPPAVPPAPYDRYKKYLAPEGRFLVRDYYLGYQYGIDVAQTAASPPRVPLVPTRTTASPAPDHGNGKLAETPKPGGEPVEAVDESLGIGEKTAPTVPDRPLYSFPLPPSTIESSPSGGNKFTPPRPPDRLQPPETPLPTQAPLLPVPPVAHPPVPPRSEPIPLPPPPHSSPTPGAASGLPLILTEFPPIPFTTDRTAR
ncbi:MAG: hypothetical protein RMJ56_14540 [Gemmataceae bacterium]|nr:hypothetical protein [Gemmata sp.]MDW8198812.1 hypothetical protein [Gemmataceae bacterium]